MPLEMWLATIGVAQWYTYSPGLRALNRNDFASPGGVCVITAPPPGPVTACKSTEWIMRLSARFLKPSSTVSPTRTLRNGPGTLPLKVQYGHVLSSPSLPISPTAAGSTCTVRGGPAAGDPGRSVAARTMLTDGGSFTTGAFAPPTLILPSMPACRWPGSEQK